MCRTYGDVLNTLACCPVATVSHLLNFYNPTIQSFALSTVFDELSIVPDKAQFLLLPGLIPVEQTAPV